MRSSEPIPIVSLRAVEGSGNRRTEASPWQSNSPTVLDLCDSVARDHASPAAAGSGPMLVLTSCRGIAERRRSVRNYDNVYP